MGTFENIRKGERKEVKMSNIDVRVCEKTTLTLEEAAALTNIGINKLREISNDKRCSFVLWVGNKRLLKRKELNDFISKSYSI